MNDHSQGERKSLLLDADPYEPVRRVTDGDPDNDGTDGDDGDGDGTDGNDGDGTDGDDSDGTDGGAR